MMRNVQRCLAAMGLSLMSCSTIANPTVNTLYTFSASWTDGANPDTPLIEDAAGNLYGTTTEGGTSGEGTVFQLSPAGALNTLHAFSPRVDTGLQFPTNTDGGKPYSLRRGIQGRYRRHRHDFSDLRRCVHDASQLQPIPLDLCCDECGWLGAELADPRL
jgi:uncharacterized repeat protein (TIGR03803 family)